MTDKTIKTISEVEEFWGKIIKGGFWTSRDREKEEEKHGLLGAILSVSMALGIMPNLETMLAISRLGEEFAPKPAWGFYSKARTEIYRALDALGKNQTMEAWDFFYSSLGNIITAMKKSFARGREVR